MRQIGLDDVLGPDRRPEAGRLLPELDHELGAHDPFGKAGVVLDVGRDRELPAGLKALEQHGFRLAREA